MLIFAALVMGALGAISAFQQAEAQRVQQQYEAEIARNNAVAKQQQAEIVRQRTESERVAADEESHEVKRKYLDAAGTNMSLLASKNVDISTGSALDLLEGNLNAFADDMGEMAYQKELNTWAGKREAQVFDYEADVLNSNASFLERTAGSVGQSLLTAGLSGLGGGLSTFAGGGGFSAGSTSTITPTSTINSSTAYSPTTYANHV
jgi:hypothetical protein